MSSLRPRARSAARASRASGRQSRSWASRTSARAVGRVQALRAVLGLAGGSGSSGLARGGPGHGPDPPQPLFLLSRAHRTQADSLGIDPGELAELPAGGQEVEALA